MTLPILFEDDAVMVLDKPAPLPVYPLTADETATLATAIIARWPELADIGRKPGEAGLLHRLDNDTSGCMLVAKTNDAFANLHDQFESGAIVKEYQALVIGRPPAQGSITTPIAHHPIRPHKMITCQPTEAAKYKARPAKTDFKTIRTFPNYALLEVQITTGVRHQIRVHLASIGYPIAGDKIYRAAKHQRLDSFNLPRHFLHASRIGFTHPRTAQWQEVASPLPAELCFFLDTLSPSS